MVILSTVKITQNTMDKAIEKTESNVHLWDIRTLITYIFSPFPLQCCFVSEYKYQNNVSESKGYLPN